MDALDLPIVTPKKVLGIRGIKEFSYDVDMAIICFRGRHASTQLIKIFSGSPIREKILHHHQQLFYSSEFNLLIVPEMVWGGPNTAIMIEELFTLGIRRLIGFGAGGSINPKVHPGVMFVAQNAICIDGTSNEYSDGINCGPDPQLLDYYADHCEESGTSLLTGLTTDSLYRETPRKIRYWRRLGADFINMEVSPFYVVSKVLGISAVYVGLITDYVGKKWESKYWGIENEIDTRIIESIRELCVTNSSESS